MEQGQITKVEFINKDKKIQIDKIYIKFRPVDHPAETGLYKTSFKAFIDKKLIGYIPLDMLALIPETKEPNSKLQVILRVAKPQNFDSIPFAYKMKTRKFLGKIFKQDHMLEINKDSNLVILSRPEYEKKKKDKRRKKK